jgi:hypothetical protein
MRQTVNQSKDVDRWTGVGSAVCVPLLGAVYIGCGAIGLSLRDRAVGEALVPVEPYVSICRLIMLLLVADLVVLFSFIHAQASHDRKTYTLAALAFVVVFAVIAGVNTFLLLTIAPLAESKPELEMLFSYRWPSVNLALDLFAWGPVLGLGLLFAAAAFEKRNLERLVRLGLTLAGLLCRGNILCFMSEDARFSILGIIGYDLVLPID